MAGDDMTAIIGKCGKFQVVLSLAINGSYMMVAFSVLFMSFGLYNPGFYCLDGNGPEESSISNISETFASSHLKEITANTSQWRKDCAVKDGCRNLIYNPESSTIVTEWDLTCDSAWIASTIISIQMCGVLVGSYVVGLIGDKFGRKLALCLSMVFLTGSHLVASFSDSWQMYAPCMFFLGIGSGGVFTGSFHYPMEFLTTWWRGVLVSIPFWNIGCMLFACVLYILKDWRHVHIAGTVVSGLATLPLLWTPESVRWLTVKGKADKAKDVITKIARMNGRPCPDTRLIDNIAQEERDAMGGYKYTYLDLFRSKTIRGYSIKFGLIWIVMAISYYAINFGIKSLSGNFYLNFFIFSVVDFPAVFSVAPSITLFGRQKSAFLYFFLAGACSLSVVLVFFVTSGNIKDTAILTLALLSKTLVLSVWYIVKVFSSELHPTVVRSLHYGYLNSVARLGGIVSPYIISKDPSSLYVPFLCIGILCLVMCGIIWTLPETKRMTMQDRFVDDTIKLKPVAESELENESA